MKKNLNVIQIHGIRGIIIAAFVVVCLAAGFIVFPGMLCMHLWNFMSGFADKVPSIGIVQGVLLWGIMIALYLIVKKDRFVVCFKTPQGLSEEELKSVFSDLKKQSVEDPVLRAMLKARETELKIKAEEQNAETTQEGCEPANTDTDKN